jgi:hypothetical protein
MEIIGLIKIIFEYFCKSGFNLLFVIINILITILYIFRLEKYKTKLTQLTQEHQIKFSHYYNERSQIIKNLFSKIYDLEISLKELQFYNTEDDNEKYRIKLEVPTTTLNILKNEFNHNRIFFSKEICLDLDVLIENIRHTLGLCSTTPNLNIVSDFQSIKDLKIKTYSDIQQNIDNIIPKIKKNIEIEFRTLLGG